MLKNQYFSTTELAKKLGISRVAVFKKIKKGEIKAQKRGRNFIIDKKEVARLLDKSVSAATFKEVDLAVKKAIKEYGETLKLLGQE